MSFIGSKTPDEVKDYTLDWSKDLGTDTIGSSSFTVAPSDVSITQTTATSTQSAVWLSGGTLGQVYQVQNRIVTAAGRDLSKSFRVLVETNNYL